MFLTHLRRELAGRRRQTIVVAAGTALAVALVMVVAGVSAGVSSAQASVLQSVYGVGTDLTVTQAAEPGTPGEGAPGERFEFGAGDGTTDDGSTQLSQSTLSVVRGSATFDASVLDTVRGVDGVSAATATLALESTTFTGELPDQQAGGATGGGADGATGGAGAPDASGTAQAPPTGGADGAGGTAFGLDRSTVTGVEAATTDVGPLAGTTLVDGRALTADDAGQPVALLDETYATTAGLAVGDAVTVAGTALEVVGTVASTTADAATASDVWVPLDTAQSLSGLAGQVSSVSVTAASAADVDAVAAALATALPDATVSTQADLAASVSGSLTTAGDLVRSLGTWLSVAVLLAAFALSVLFTVSGVGRRTREFGTLKAIGWTNGRIVRQVAGESLVQGVLGGAVGVALGLVATLVVDAVAPTLSAGAVTAGPGAGGAGGPGGDVPSGGPAGLAEQAASAVTLHLPVTVGIVLLAVGLAVLGGLLAGAVGGWRAARLRPAEALRSVA